MKTNVLYKNVFTNNKPIEFYSKNFKFFAFTLVDLVFGYLLFMNIHITNILVWLAVYLLYFIINGIITFIMFYVFKEVTFINRLKNILNFKKIMTKEK